MEGDIERINGGRFVERPEKRQLKIKLEHSDGGLAELESDLEDFKDKLGGDFKLDTAGVLVDDDGDYWPAASATAKEAELHELAMWLNHLAEQAGFLANGLANYWLSPPAGIRDKL